MPRIEAKDLLGQGDSQEIRAKRRRRTLARQTVIFGWIVLAMAAVLVVSLPFAMGLVSLPFGNSFVLSEEAKAKVPPCAPKGKPVSLQGVTVNIFNGSSQNGLATQTAQRLKGFGIKVNVVGNSPDSYAGTARINTSKANVAKAFSLARALPEADVRIDLNRGPEINVLLGEQFQGALAMDNLSDGDLGPYPPAPKNCQEVD